MRAITSPLRRCLLGDNRRTLRSRDDPFAAVVRGASETPLRVIGMVSIDIKTVAIQVEGRIADEG